MNLTEFLLARIAEDEGTALYAQTRGALQPEDWGGWWFGHHQHYSRHDPTRVVAECEAKRRIISRCDMVLRGRGAGMFNDGQATDAADNLRSLALPYADHPDYNESWRV